jgi:hypothetical protein
MVGSYQLKADIPRWSRLFEQSHHFIIVLKIPGRCRGLDWLS